MRKQKIATALLCALLSFCFAGAGLLACLGLTLFKEGYLIKRMEQAGYYQTVASTIQLACQGYAADAGLTPAALDSFVQPQLVREDILARTDSLFRGSARMVEGRFSGLSTGLAEETRQALGLEPNAEQKQGFSVLQILCEGTYQGLAAPPFEEVLRVLAPARAARGQWWALFAALGAAALFLLKRAAQGGFPAALARALLAAGGAVAALGAAARWLAPYRSWMPQGNMAYPLFCSWWAGLPQALFCCALALAAGGVALAVWPAPRRGEPVPKNGMKQGERWVFSAGKAGGTQQ